MNMESDTSSDSINKQIPTPENSEPSEISENSESSESSENKALANMAHMFSDVFSPILMSTYAVVCVLWFTRYNFIPVNTRWLTVLYVFAITAFVPALTVFILMRLGKVSDTAISDRRQRPLPFAVTALCSLGAYCLVRELGYPDQVAFYLAAGMFIAIIEGFISLWWKISAHTAAAGAFLGYTIIMAKLNILTVNYIWAISLMVLLGGLIAWARLYLFRHTPLQVLGGWALGLVVCMATYYIL